MSARPTHSQDAVELRCAPGDTAAAPAPSMEVPMRYQFIVVGPVSDVAAAELPDMASTTHPTGGIALFGPVQDESDALTMLGRIRGLGLSVIEMRRLPD